MRSSRVALGLAALFFLSLIVSAPARVLSALVPQDTLLLQGLTGSVWRGSAARVKVAAMGGYLHLGSVQWRLSPLSLISFAPTLDIESQWGGQQVSGKLRLRGAGDIDFQDLDVRISASLLRQISPLMLGGRFSLQALELNIRDGLPLSGEGRLIWQDASWLSPQGPVPLGQYAVDFNSAPEQALRGEIVTLNGPVNAAGTVVLNNGNYALDVLLGSDTGFDPQLQQAISLLAAPAGDQFRIELKGNF